MSPSEQPKRRKKRKHKLPERIDKFLADSSQESMPMDLYAREIRYYLSKYHPRLIIDKDELYPNRNCWKCTLRKQS